MLSRLLPRSFSFTNWSWGPTAAKEAGWLYGEEDNDTERSLEEDNELDRAVDVWGGDTGNEPSLEPDR